MNTDSERIIREYNERLTHANTRPPPGIMMICLRVTCFFLEFIPLLIFVIPRGIAKCYQYLGDRWIAGWEARGDNLTQDITNYEGSKQ